MIGMTDFTIEAEREVDHVFLAQLREMAAKIEAENDRLRRESEHTEKQAMKS